VPRALSGARSVVLFSLQGLTYDPAYLYVSDKSPAAPSIGRNTEKSAKSGIQIPKARSLHASTGTPPTTEVNLEDFELKANVTADFELRAATGQPRSLN
jgi:hypothetical protein